MSSSWSLCPDDLTAEKIWRAQEERCKLQVTKARFAVMITVLSVTQGEGFGAEVVLSELLAAWPTDAGRLRIVAPDNSRIRTAASENHHTIVLFDSNRDAIRSNWRAAGRICDELADATCIHAWTARGFEMAWRISRSLRIPLAGTLHDHPRAAFHGRVRRNLMSISAREFRGLVCVSQAVREAAVQARYRCPLEVIRNGLADLPDLKPGPGTGRVRIGFLGMYAMWKGFSLVRRWVDEIRDLPVDWMLYGDVAKGIQKEAQQLQANHRGHVHLLGRRPTREIFSNIDILVHASTGFDPLPTVLIESARAGIPSVACRNGGAEEIVEDGKTGFLFEPSQPQWGLKKCRELIMDSELRHHQSVAARRLFLKNFNVDRMVSEYDHFWSGIVATSQ